VEDHEQETRESGNLIDHGHQISFSAGRWPLATGHCSRPAILYLVHRLPYPPDKGDRIRAFHLLRWLSGRAAVHLACLADEPVDAEAVAALGRYCERVAVVRLGAWSRWARAGGSLARGHTATEGAFSAPALRATLRRWARQTRFHAALASASSMAPYLRLDAIRDVPAVIDLVDVDSQKWREYAAAGRGPRAWLHRLEGRRLRRLERTLPGWARAVTLVSEAEADLYRGHVGPGPVHAVTNGVDLGAFRPAPGPEGQGCVFVGALDYRPNVDAAQWFCREVWPGIRRRRPDAVLRLVGRRPTAAVRRLVDRPGVELVGPVPDVRPYLAAAAVVVAPLRIARGVQNKVLEALAMGKAVVASPQALAGLAVEPGTQALAAASPAAWVEAVLRLLDDPDLRRRLGVQGRRYVERHHDWDRCLEPFGPLLSLAGRDDPTPRDATDPVPPGVALTGGTT
jgi:sugar transferase (PEP-CTERM/EpsH1 system associated)